MTVNEVRRRVSMMTWADLATNNRSFHDHFGLSDKDLKDRIFEENKRSSSSIDISKEVAFEMIKSYILENEVDWITDWLNDNTDGENYEIWIDADKPIGRVYNKYAHDWKFGAIPASRIVVALRKDELRSTVWFKFASIYADATKEDLDSFKAGVSIAA